jgi:hypothetical protein
MTENRYTEPVYVVTMYRWGDQESHSYVVGVFASKLQAEHVAYDEREYRGGKYEGHITEWTLDNPYDREADIKRTAGQIRRTVEEYRPSLDTVKGIKPDGEDIG